MTTQVTSDWVLEHVKSRPMLVEISQLYLESDFNLHGLNTVIPNYKAALAIVKGKYSGDIDQEMIQNARNLFTYIHSRYVLTIEGSMRVGEKYKEGCYGCCPNSKCHECHLLPYGQDITPGQFETYGYCPNCQDLYRSDFYEDGANFGPYFAAFYTQTMHADIQINKSSQNKVILP